MVPNWLVYCLVCFILFGWGWRDLVGLLWIRLVGLSLLFCGLWIVEVLLLGVYLFVLVGDYLFVFVCYLHCFV